MLHFLFGQSEEELMEDLYARLLAAASLRSEDSALRMVAEYEPLGGPGAPISPPTAIEAGARVPGHLVEERWVAGERAEVVLLDQQQSQANRCETGLSDAVQQGEVFVPHLELATEVFGQPLRLTSLEAPHRSRDAYFRDSLDADGQSFDATQVGQALRDARADMRPYLEWVPTELAYGVWDSHRKRRVQVKVPRAYTSHMFGLRPLQGKRAAGRTDPWNLPGEKVAVSATGWTSLEGAKPAKGTPTATMSELGHGMIPPTIALGGVSVQAVQRQASVSMAQLAALRFGDAPKEYAAAGRALVAALALLGDRLAFAAPGLRLRSGCDLVLVHERLEWVQRGRDGAPVTEALEISSPEEALELFRLALEAAREAGVKWADEPVVVRPTPGLQQAIEKSFALRGIGEAESE
jgi:CRISPR-associated protein Csb1